MYKRFRSNKTHVRYNQYVDFLWLYLESCWAESACTCSPFKLQNELVFDVCIQKEIDIVHKVNQIHSTSSQQQLIEFQSLQLDLINILEIKNRVTFMLYIFLIELDQFLNVENLAAKQCGGVTEEKKILVLQKFAVYLEKFGTPKNSSRRGTQRKYQFHSTDRKNVP